MSSQKSKVQGAQLDLNAKPLPALVEYKVEGVLWRCCRFDLLAAEFPLTVEQLALFHAAAGTTERGWLMVRRLFGLQPVVPPSSTQVDDLRVWPREELREALGLTRAQVKAELDAVRGVWKGIMSSVPHLAAGPAAAPPRKEARDEFQFSDDELLLKHGLLTKFGSVDEKGWFAQRVRDYEKILNEKFASVLARNALMNELRLRQIDEFLNNSGTVTVGGAEWKSSLKLRQELDTQYQAQVKQLREVCPWAGAVAGKYAFTGVISDITQAIQAYRARNDTRLIDGIFTATEIQVECRRSVQASEPRYRAGLVTYLNAARAGLWDPNWKPAFESPVLKRIDAGWKAAFVAAADADIGRPQTVPDLEQDGPQGEMKN